MFRLAVIATTAVALVSGQGTQGGSSGGGQQLISTQGGQAQITYFAQPQCGGSSVPVTVAAGQCVQSGANSFVVQCGANGGVAFYCRGSGCQSCNAITQPFNNGQCLDFQAGAGGPPATTASSSGGKRQLQGSVLVDGDTAAGTAQTSSTIVARSVKYQCSGGQAQQAPAQPPSGGQAAAGGAQAAPSTAPAGAPAPIPPKPNSGSNGAGSVGVAVAAGLAVAAAVFAL